MSRNIKSWTDNLSVRIALLLAVILLALPALASAQVPVVTIAATDAAASEVGPDTGTFTFTRVGDTTFALTVFYTTGGTAVNGVDYSGIPANSVIPAGSATATRTITPVNDALVEGPETVTLTLTDDAQYDLGATTTDTVTIADGVPLDHFLCYKAKTTPGKPKFEPQTVSLADQFESGNAQVKKPVSLCNPADKDNGGINDPNTHLKGYQIKPETPHVPQTNIKIENQFHPSRGELFVDTIKPDRLLVPTAKSLTGPIGEPGPNNVDHYKCYKVKVSKGAEKFKPILGVSVDDQFTDGDKLFDLKKPTKLCNPVDKNGEGIKDETAHLMCYQAKPAKGEPKHVPVTGIFVNNQFGQERLDTIKEEELCVPSEKILP